ncbi:clathrin interactor 1-like [Xenia sp. Carnegie-2017]|uniref:clathrin interactor 1-like n=1 Tax=Xenia sp. Carnegie-2017 TaxID=2897299 RepID=UPI001F03AAD6|nr:clathrin interactor 1-like [Xenia sp. Carnegie-2017]
MWKIREIQDKVTNMVMNYSEVESKVREATNDDTWGPHGTLMSEIAKYTYTYEHFPEVMSMLWKRMLLERKNWRRAYKSLLLLAYLIRNGSERVVTSARDHIYDMRQLEDYQHIDEHGRDQGINIRHKVKELIEMVNDDQRLREERKKAKKSKDKYKGVSSEEVSRKYDYSDRYSSEPKNFDDAYDEFEERSTRKSSIRKFRERAYSSNNEYRDEVSSKSDEEEGEDALKPKQPIPAKEESPIVKKTVRKVNLGAAANYGQTQKETPKVEEMTLKEQAQMSQNSASNELVDLFSSSEIRPVASSIPPFQSAPGQNADGSFGTFESANKQNGNDFADFTAFSEAKSTSVNDDFAEFKSSGHSQQSTKNSDNVDLFQDFTSASSSNQDLLSKPTGVSGNPSLGFQQTNQPMQPMTMSASMQPAMMPVSSDMTSGMINHPGKMGNIMNGSPMMPGNQGGSLMSSGQQPMMGGAYTFGNQPMMSGGPTMVGGSNMMGGAYTMSGQPMMAGTPMMGGAGIMGAPTNMMGGVQSNMMGGAPPNMMGGSTAMNSSSLMGNVMASSQANVMRAQSNVPKSSDSKVQQGKSSQQVSSTKSTTWSNSGVDISLDNLAPMSHKEKPAQPSMNQLYMQNSPQMTSPNTAYYGNGGMQPMMYTGNPLGMNMNMSGKAFRQMNMSTPPNMMNRGMMAQGGAMNMQQPGMVGANQNFGRVMQFK